MTWFDWAKRPSPFTGFGDDTNTSIKFVHFTGLHEPMPAWSGGGRKFTRHDIGNGQTVTQAHGGEDRTLTLRMWFATQDDLEIMASLVGQTATLRYRTGIIAYDGADKATIGDTTYLVLPDTQLASLTGREKATLGFPEATATFWRPYTPSPYYGFSVYAEES
jgi:hypothetical protein